MKRLPALILALACAACARAGDGAMQGYGEADYVYISSQEPGRIAQLNVREGDAVEPGDVVFSIESQRLDYPLQGAAAQRAAVAQAAQAARVDAELARANYQRTMALQRGGFVSQARVDTDRAALDAANARLEESRRQIAATSADVGLLRERRLDLSGAAPAAGTIERIYHRAGEVVGAGEPVAALLVPANMKVRFFAPEAMLSRLRPGVRVAVQCDGCGEAAMGAVSFVAREPQFTPPVIYSLEERDKLVFLVEARLDEPGRIRPGVPVDVRLAGE